MLLSLFPVVFIALLKRSAWVLSLAVIALTTTIGCAPRSFTGRPLTPYALYYGADENLERLFPYQLVVIQPWAYTAVDVLRLKKNGVLVLGYISVGEDDELHRDDGKGPGGYASWYVDQYTGKDLSTPKPDGQPDMNPDWNSPYVNPAHPRWQRHIRNKAKAMKRELGIDGFFVDTALVPRNVFTIDLEKKMEEGMGHLVRRMKRWSGGGYVLVNNGWRDYERWKDDVNGIMVESRDTKEFSKIKQRLDEVAAGKHVDAFALVYLNSANEEKIASTCDELRKKGYKIALYPDDSMGRTLATLPITNCLDQPAP